MSDHRNKQLIHSRGIFHGLPDLSDSPIGLTAIVTGANGISGSYMLRVLCENPERWSKIYAFSRRPPSGGLPQQVEHIAVDFLSSPEKIAALINERGIKVDYVFFFSYILLDSPTGPTPWGNPELVRVNDLILSNFLEALAQSSIPKRFFLQTGGKFYGIHLGPTNLPHEESDPRITLEPNLYYTQEDMLRKYCEKHCIHWNIGLPSFILAAPTDSAQSLLFPLSVYAAVQKYLGKPLEFPSDLPAWDSIQSMSTAILNSYLYEWSVLTEGAKDQSFNASDDCQFTWGKFWPRLAEFYGIEYTGPDLSERANFKETETKYAVRGYGPKGIFRSKFSFVDWAKSQEVQTAWKELTAKHQLQLRDILKDVGPTFGRVDFALQRSFSSVLSATKAKKFGFFGFVDTYEAIFSVIEEYVAIKILPPV